MYEYIVSVLLIWKRIGKININQYNEDQLQTAHRHMNVQLFNVAQKINQSR